MTNTRRKDATDEAVKKLEAATPEILRILEALLEEIAGEEFRFAIALTFAVGKPGAGRVGLVTLFNCLPDKASEMMLGAGKDLAEAPGIDK